MAICFPAGVSPVCKHPEKENKTRPESLREQIPDFTFWRAIKLRTERVYQLLPTETPYVLSAISNQTYNSAFSHSLFSVDGAVKHDHAFPRNDE